MIPMHEEQILSNQRVFTDMELSFHISKYTIIISAPCFFCNWQTSSVIKSIQNIVEVECRHDEHPDEDAGNVCKCGEKPSCAGTDKPFCVDGQCQGSCVQRKLGLKCFIIFWVLLRIGMVHGE